MPEVSEKAALDLLNPEWLTGPAVQQAFRVARAERPISWFDSPDGGFWAALRYQDIVEISRRPEFSTARGVALDDVPGATRGALIFTDPPEHRRLRNTVNDFFSPRETSRMKPWLADQCRLLIDGVKDRTEIDFIYDLAAELPLATISEMLGIPVEKRKQFLGLANRIFDEIGVSQTDLLQAMNDVASFGVELANAHHKDDLFAAIRAAEMEGKRLDDEEFGQMFRQIAAAGVETTRTMLGAIALHLVRQPELIDIIHNNSGLVRTAVEEFLRYYPPVFFMRRTVKEDVVIGGVSMKAGDRVLMYYLSANFDEEIFTDPVRFDIRRSPNPHLTFGTGQHICLGLVLARAELCAFLEEFVRQVSKIELVGTPDVRTTPLGVGYKRIPVKLTYRK